MDEINTQMAAQAMAVQIWINWMTLCFFASLVFIRRRPGARLALAAMLLTMVTAMGIFAIEPNVHLFGLAHLIFWGPLLVYLLRVDGRPVAVALAGCSVSVTALTLRTPTLDDVFLELTGAHLREEEQ